MSIEKDRPYLAESSLTSYFRYKKHKEIIEKNNLGLS
jgi:hypothetical protein